MSTAIVNKEERKELFVKHMQEVLPDHLQGEELAIGDDFLLNEKGVFKLTIDHGSMVKKKILNVPLIISKIGEDQLTECYAAKLEVMRNNRWKDLGWVSAGIISNNTDLLNNISDRCPDITSHNICDVVWYLGEFRSFLEGVQKPATIVSKIGWFKDKYYFPANEDKEDIFFKLGDADFAAAIKGESGSDVHWLEAVLGKFRYHSSKYRFLLSCSFLPVLLRPLNYQLSPMIGIVGPKGCGKTTILKVAASVWGDMGLVQSYDGTINGLEAIAINRDDGPLFLDDTQVNFNYKNSESNNANAIYKLANSNSKHRADRFGNALKTQSWRTAAMLTGEQSLFTEKSMGGMRRRLLEINLEEQMPRELITELYNTLEHNNGWGIRGFLYVVDKLGKDAIRKLYKKFLDFLLYLEGLQHLDEKHHHTHLEYVAMVMTADVIFSFGFTRIELTGKYEGFRRYEPEYKQTLEMGLDIYQQLPFDEDYEVTGQYFYDKIISWVNSKLNYFGEKLDAGKEDWGLGGQMGEKYGFFYDDTICFYPAAFAKMVKEIEHKFSIDIVKNYLKRDDFFICNNNRGCQRVVRVNSAAGATVNVYCLKKPTEA